MKFAGRAGQKIRSNNAPDLNLMSTLPSNGFIIATMDGRTFLARGAKSADEALAEFQRKNGALMQVESVRPDYSGGDYARGAARGAVIGGAMGLPMGGPVGAGTGALGGAAGELAGMGIGEMGVGTAGQFGGSLAADIGTSIATRRPTAGLARRIPGVMEATEKGIEYLGKGGAIKRFLGRNWGAEATGYTQRQAGKAITDLPLPSAVDPATGVASNPALEVATSLRSAHQMMDDVYQEAAEQAKKETMGSYGRTEGLVRKATELEEAFNYLDEVPKVLRQAAELPGEITLQEAENIRKGVGAAYAKGQLPLAEGGIPHYKEMAGLYGPLDNVLEDIASHSESGETAVDAVKKMRGARKAMHKAAPEGELMYRHLIGKGRMDNAQKALDKILSSDRAVSEVKKMRGLMSGVGEDIALRRAAIVHVLQRRLGQQADSVLASPQTGGAAIGKASAEAAALTEILGIRGYANLMEILEGVASPGRGSRKFSARLPTGTDGGMSRLLFILAGGAGAGGTISPEAGAAVLAMGGVVESFMRQNGKEAVANLALSALTDPDIYRQIAMGAGVKNAEAAAVRLGQTLLRRGLFTEDELGGDG